MNNGYDYVVRQLLEQQEETVELLGHVIALRSKETERHCWRVGVYSSILAGKLGWDDDDAARLGLAARLHDIGKVAVKNGILDKPGPLDAEEQKLVQRHPEVGGIALTGSDTLVVQIASEVAWTHHERWDGEGYPAGLYGRQIPFVGRVAAVADVWDAMQESRPYRPEPVPVGKVLDYMYEQKAHHFDPDVVDAFIENLALIQSVPR